MNTRSLTIAVSTVLLLLLIIVAGAQNRRASTLHAQELALLTQPNETAPAAEPDAVTATRDGDLPSASASPELLQLRSQVGQLMQRRRELLSVRAENEQLRGRVSARNTSATNALPADYIRRKQARWMGQNTPENTLESFLWAIQNRSITNIESLLTPRSAAQFTQTIAAQGDALFNESAMLPGMRIASQKRQPDGTIEATIEIIPGQSNSGGPLIFRMIDGQWKLDFGN
jgi:hypothetical protein